MLFLVASEIFLTSARMRLSTRVGACLTVPILRTFCVLEKEFLQKYCLLDNVVCAACRHQADIKLALLSASHFFV